MDLRNKIWYDLIDAKYGEIYLAFYISKQKSLKKGIKITTLIFSGGGALGWTFWQYIPVVACLIISIIQLISLIENDIIRSDKEIEELCDLRNMYVTYFNQLDKLWFEINNNYNEEKTSKSFFSLRKNEFLKIEKLDNKLYIRELKSILEKTDLKARDYLTKYN